MIYVNAILLGALRDGFVIRGSATPDSVTQGGSVIQGSSVTLVYHVCPCASLVVYAPQGSFVTLAYPACLDVSHGVDPTINIIL